jgi:hypothetical protein
MVENLADWKVVTRAGRLEVPLADSKVDYWVDHLVDSTAESMVWS